MSWGKIMISTEWLQNHLNDENIRIIDIRGRVLPATEPPPHYFSHHDAYVESHIPGAVFVDWMTDIVEPESPTYDVAAPERYAALMSRLGVGDETQVIAYDDADGMFAARLWWTLKYYGHKQVVVLDGGWQKWMAESRPVTAEVPTMQPAVFNPRQNMGLRRSDDQVLQQLDTDTLLIDTRSPVEFNGEASRANRKGHIPGAVNIPRKSLLDADGRLLPRDELRAKFAEAGLKRIQQDVVFYCNSGVSASFGLLVLQVAGFMSGSVYDSSWKSWGNDETRPIES